MMVLVIDPITLSVIVSSEAQKEAFNLWYFSTGVGKKRGVCDICAVRTCAHAHHTHDTPMPSLNPLCQLC